MSPLNSNSKIFTLQQVKTILQSQFKNVQFSFLLFFQSMLCCTVYFTKNVCFFFLFFPLYAVFNNVQVSLSFFFLFVFFFFLHFHCPVAFCFCFGLHFFFLFFFIFFHNKLLIQCPLFFSTLYLPLCLYLKTITIGSLPSLFNFSL